MVINENLMAGYSDPKTIKAENKAYTNIDYYIPSNLEENHEYTISIDTIQYNGSGELSLKIYDKSHTRMYYEKIVKANTRSFISFKYLPGSTEKILVYSDVAGKINNAELKTSNIKLEKGDIATPYIPSKNNLDPSKQAIFKAGGVFQEVYPL